MPTPRCLPVNVDFTAGGGFDSHGLSYEDYAGMHMIDGAPQAPQRRLDTPDWALNDSRMRDVIVRYTELRAQFRHPLTGTPEYRLQCAIKRRLDYKPDLTETLTHLAKRYVAVKKAGNDPALLKKLGIEIEGIDTQLRFLGKDHTLALGVIYHYYRCGSDSVETGAALEIKPPHVRQILWRLHKAARIVAAEVRVSMHINLLRGLKSDPLAVPRHGQKKCWTCGALFTPTAPQHKICSVKCKKKRLRQQARARHKAKTRHITATQRFFCSEVCKATGWNIKKVMLMLKPGVGKFVPPPGGDSYNTYEAYCNVVGAEPMTRAAWSQGGLCRQ
jgi:hypothetical protein